MEVVVPVYTMRIGQMEANYHFMCGAVFYRELPLGLVEVKIVAPRRGLRRLLEELARDYQKDLKPSK